MSAPAKFLFDLDFSGGGRELTITLADHAVKLAAAETAAQRRGYAEAQADGMLESSRRIAAALGRIAAGLEEANGALQAIETRLECEAVEVAVAVARKLAPALIAREPFAEVAALARDCFQQLIAAPHIVVRVGDELYADARDKLNAVVQAHGFQGRLVVLGDPAIAPGDCRIEWADGGLNRDGAATDAAIGQAVARYLDARRGSADLANDVQEVRQ
jgi:flagellar assembly protein FliH